MTLLKPTKKPFYPCFSSGPTAKYPGWNPSLLSSALVGRSHRSRQALDRLDEVLQRTRELLNLPDDYQIALVPGSTTGAFTMAFWSLLGARDVDIFAWDVFGHRWADEIQNYLQLKDCRVFSAPPGKLPELNNVNGDNDIVFSWNGTTAGVCVPDAAWIPDKREGLVFCDAISSIFVEDLPWPKLDITAFSWQKTLGGEAGIGVLILSPKAYQQLENYTPSHPIPSLLSFKDRAGKIRTGLFQGKTSNTISLLCVEDFLHALKWAETVGGLPGLKRRATANSLALQNWVERSHWANNLAANPAIRSITSPCLTIDHPQFLASSSETQWQWITTMTSLLEHEQVAYDIKNHAFSCPSLRIWTGPTVETSDINDLCPWLDWAFEKTLQSLKN